MNDDAETYTLLAAGRLEQVCPIECRVGWREHHPGPESAGHYCTACGARTGPKDWRRAERSPSQQAATAAIGASKSKESGQTLPHEARP